MPITKNKAVTIAYQVSTEDGSLVDETTIEQPLEYLHGHRNLLIGLEKALEGREIGDKFVVTITPEEAYGAYNNKMVQRVAKDMFVGADDLEVGMRFMADTDNGQLPVVITEIDGDNIVVDGNHFLAGQQLTFDVNVIAIREATLEEMAHGHLHQEGHHCCSSHADDESGGCSSGHGCGCNH